MRYSQLKVKRFVWRGQYVAVSPCHKQKEGMYDAKIHAKKIYSGSNEKICSIDSGDGTFYFTRFIGLVPGVYREIFFEKARGSK